MKHTIKNGIIFWLTASIVFLLCGVVYAAWNDTVSTGDPVTAAKWNELVAKIWTLDQDISFSARLDTIQTGPAGTWTELDFKEEDYDTTWSFDLITNRFQPNVSWKYLISLNISCVDLQANNWCSATIAKNWDTVAHESAYVNQSGSASFHSLTSIVELNGTTDYISSFFNTSDSTPQISWGSHIEGKLLSR